MRSLPLQERHQLNSNKKLLGVACLPVLKRLGHARSVWCCCRPGAARQDREGPAGGGMQEAPAPAARLPASRPRADAAAVPHVHGLPGVDKVRAPHRPVLGQHRQSGGWRLLLILWPLPGLLAVAKMFSRYLF